MTEGAPPTLQNLAAGWLATLADHLPVKGPSDTAAQVLRPPGTGLADTVALLHSCGFADAARLLAVNGAALPPSLTQVIRVAAAITRELPPVGAAEEENARWAYRARRTLRSLLRARGIRFDLIRSAERGGSIEPLNLAPDRADAFVVFVYSQALAMLEAFLLEARGHQAVALETALHAAHRLQPAAPPLVPAGVLAEFAPHLFTSYVARTLTLEDPEGTRLRTSLETRHGAGQAPAALKEDLPGAVEVARREQRVPSGRHGQLSREEYARRLQMMRRSAEMYVERATGVWLDGASHSRTVPFGEGVLQGPVMDAEEAFLFRDAFARAERLMTPRELDVLRLAHLSPTVIATQLGITASTVRGLKRRAMVKLRRELSSALGA